MVQDVCRIHSEPQVHVSLILNALLMDVFRPTARIFDDILTEIASGSGLGFCRTICPRRIRDCRSVQMDCKLAAILAHCGSGTFV